MLRRLENYIFFVQFNIFILVYLALIFESNTVTHVHYTFIPPIKVSEHKDLKRSVPNKRRVNVREDRKFDLSSLKAQLPSYRFRYLSIIGHFP